MSRLTKDTKATVGSFDAGIEARREAAAWAEIARKLNLLYTNHAIPGHKVELTDAAFAPGWTDMKHVYLSEPLLVNLRRKLDRRTYLAAVKGLSFHELFHLLYSPTGQWRKDLIDEGHNTAWNILEDQRIESLGTAVWPRMGRLIAVTVAQFILKGDHGDSSWPLLIGRRYLPVSLRVEYRQKWLDATGAPDTVADELEDIVTEYVGLVHPADNDRAAELVARFSALLNAWSLSNYGGYSSLDGHDSRGRGSGARPARQQAKDAKKAKDEAQDDLDAQRKATADKAASAAAGDDADDAADAGAGAGTDDSDSDSDDKAGAGSGTGDDDSGDGDATDTGGGGGDTGDSDTGDATDADASGSDGSGPGAGAPSNDPKAAAPGDGSFDWNDISSVSDLLDTALNELADEIDEAGAVLAKTKDNLPAWKYVPAHKPHGYRPPVAGSRTLARQITKVLRRAQDDAAAGRLRGQRSGRVNVRKVGAELADPKGNRDLWDRWVEDATQDVSAEVVILTDTSGSTYEYRQQYAEALWVLKKGLEDANVPTTVATFDDSTELLWRGGERRKGTTAGVPILNIGGGTNPSTAAHEARQQLRRSTAAIRMIVILTDGAWFLGSDSGTLPADTTIAAADADGIVTVLVGFDNAVKHYGSHGCQYARDLSDPRDIVPLLTEAINRRMRTAIKDRVS